MIRNNRLLFLLLGVELAFAAAVALSMATTADEQTHWEYGRNVLLGHPERTRWDFDSKMPVTALNAVPIALGRVLQEHGINTLPVRALADKRSGRFVTIAFLLLLTWVVYRWTFELYGRHAALAAVLLSILEPNLMAHGTVLTTDLYAALAIVASCYTAWRFVRAPTAARALAAAAVAGASLLTKFSAVYLVVILPVTIGLALMAGRGGESPVRPRLVALYGGAAIFFALLFVNLGFEFRGTLTPLSRYSFRSEAFRRLQSIPVLAQVPMPLPVPFLKGLDMTKDNEQTGLCCANYFLLGEVRPSKDPRPRPFPGYYLVTYLVKEPIALQVLLIAGVVLLCRRPWREFFLKEAFLLVPVAVLFVALSFFNRAQIGIRHFLPCLVLLLPLCASCFARWSAMNNGRRAALACLAGYAAVSVLWYAPHLIPYTNELVWDKKNAFHVIADSNLDWNQAEWAVRDYVRRHPDVAVAPFTPTSGRVVASMNILSGVLLPERYGWLRERCRPVGHVAWAHVICEVPPDAPLVGVSRR